MPKFVAINSFVHNYVVHPAGEVIDLSEYEGKKLGHQVQRIGGATATALKQEEKKAEAAAESAENAELLPEEEERAQVSTEGPAAKSSSSKKRVWKNRK